MNSPKPTSPPVETADGSLEQALANGRALLAEHPQLALKQAQVILSKDRQQPRALRLAAAAHRALGEIQFAERAELIAIESSNHIPVLAAAAKAMGKRDFGEASRLAAEHLAKEPDDLAALALSAESAIGIGVPDKAIPLLQRVVQRAPEFTHAHVLLVSALMLTDQLDAGLAYLEKPLEGSPDSVDLLRLKSRLLDGKGDFEGSAEAKARVVELRPTSAVALCNLGNALRFCGKKREAIDAYRGAIVLDARHGQSWWSLADLDPSEISDEELSVMLDSVNSSDTEADSVFNLHIAIGIALHEREQYEMAFTHFKQGNELRRLAETFDSAAFSREVDDAIAQLEAAPPPANAEPKDRTPIFVVGMPRAGSTLLERILGEHSQIEPLGEMQIIPRMVQRIQHNVGEDELAAEYARMPAADAAHLGTWYDSRSNELARTDLPYFTDKLHMNWRHLGLILRIRPDAKIIDIRRNAMDCCWSNFRTLFARGYPAAHGLETIGQFYRGYVKFCDWLRDRHPDRIHYLEYENLIENPDEELNRLMDYLGISFEPEMLEFHRSQAPVATASSEQVRQPLNRKGIGVAAPYEPWLSPLRDALGDLA